MGPLTSFCTDTQTEVLVGFPTSPTCVKNSMSYKFCIYHYISHFATLSIDEGAEASPIKCRFILQATIPYVHNLV